jgi:hypothetical protein
MATDAAAAAAGPGPGFGAAAASLTDPACKPGTSDFAAAEKRNNELLEMYNKSKAEFEQKQQVRAAVSAACKVLLLAALSPAEHTQPQTARSAVVLHVVHACNDHAADFSCCLPASKRLCCASTRLAIPACCA